MNHRTDIETLCHKPLYLTQEEAGTLMEISLLAPEGPIARQLLCKLGELYRQFLRDEDAVCAVCAQWDRTRNEPAETWEAAPCTR